MSGACHLRSWSEPHKRGGAPLVPGARLADTHRVLVYTVASMKRLRGPWIALALALSALLPLVQAHCMFMPLEARAAAAEAPSHGCCDSAPAQDTAPCGPTECACFQLPPSTVPAVTAATAPTAGPPLAVLDATTAATPRPGSSAPAIAPDVGSAPLPIAVHAHGLRAPPLSV